MILAEGVDSIVLTSQHYWSSNGSFKAQFSHTSVCVSLWIESFETFTVFVYRLDLIKQGWNHTSYTKWPFYWLIDMLLWKRTQNGNHSFPELWHLQILPNQQYKTKDSFFIIINDKESIESYNLRRWKIYVWGFCSEYVWNYSSIREITGN